MLVDTASDLIPNFSFECGASRLRLIGAAHAGMNRSEWLHVVIRDGVGIGFGPIK